MTNTLYELRIFFLQWKEERKETMWGKCVVGHTVFVSYEAISRKRERNKTGKKSSSPKLLPDKSDGKCWFGWECFSFTLGKKIKMDFLFVELFFKKFLQN